MVRMFNIGLDVRGVTMIYKKVLMMLPVEVGVRTVRTRNDVVMTNAISVFLDLLRLILEVSTGIRTLTLQRHGK